MSLKRGWDALSCKETDRVARSELSANMHWPLVKKVTGMDVDTTEQRIKASEKFIQEWDYDYFWYVHSCVSIDRDRPTWFPDHGGPDYLQRNNPRARRTSMGHAEYGESVDGKGDFKSERNQGFKDMEDALTLDPLKEYGTFDIPVLTREFQAVYEELKGHLPDTLTSGGVYVTLFSGLIEIYGWEMLLMLITEPDFSKVVEGYFQWSKQFYDAYAHTDIPVINSHDDLVWTTGPAANPEWYRKEIIPRIGRLWLPLKEAGKKIIYTCDGNMTEFIDDFIGIGADMIITEPMTDFQYIADHYPGKVAFFGTFDTRVLLMGTKGEIFKEVESHLKQFGDIPGYFFGTGNHIPLNTPLDNALWYQEAFERYSRR